MIMMDSTSRTNSIDCATAVGAAALAAEERKRKDCAPLAVQYDFVPFAVETSDVLGQAFNDLLQNIRNLVRQSSGEPRETSWLRQHVS